MTGRSRMVGQEPRLDDLAVRITAEGRGVLGSYRREGNWGGLFIRWAPILAVGATAAILGTLWWLPAAPVRQPIRGTVVERSIGPDDPLGAQVLYGSEPPSAGALFTLRSP